MRHVLLLASLSLTAACGGGAGVDAGVDAGTATDADARDGGALDAGPLDAGALDAGTDAPVGVDSGAPDAGPGDAGMPDAGPGCAPTEIFTAARGCVAAVALELAPLAQAAVDCWNYAAAHSNDNVLCFAIDAHAASVPISATDYDTWACGTATAADFRGGAADLVTAQDLSACGGVFDADNSDFVVDPLPAGVTGEQCVAFDNTAVNEVQFDACANFSAASYPAVGF